MSLIPYNATRLYIKRMVDFQIASGFFEKWGWKPDKAVIFKELEKETEWSDFKKLLSKSKGQLEAIILWKGGDSFTKLVVANKRITQETIVYDDVKHKVQSLCNAKGVFRLNNSIAQIKSFLISRGEICVGYVYAREGYQSVEYCDPSEVKSIDGKIHEYPFLLLTEFGIMKEDYEDYDSFNDEWNRKWHGSNSLEEKE